MCAKETFKYYNCLYVVLHDFTSEVKVFGKQITEYRKILGFLTLKRSLYCVNRMKTIAYAFKYTRSYITHETV